MAFRLETHSNLDAASDSTRSILLTDESFTASSDDRESALFSKAIAEPLATCTPQIAFYESDEVGEIWRKVDETGFRIADLVIAFSLLVFMSPIMILCWLMVIASGPGPAVFSHRRIGRYGQEFNCFKFRTMVDGAEALLIPIMSECNQSRGEWAAAQKLSNDPRVTGIGGVLRRFSLDELPQLFNVILGEMSMVGPRPIVRSEVSRYGEFFRDYCSVKPGMTGLWQVSGRNALPYDERVRLDLQYARSRSLWLYMVILCRTLPVVILGRGC